MVKFIFFFSQALCFTDFSIKFIMTELIILILVSFSDRFTDLATGPIGFLPIM